MTGACGWAGPPSRAVLLAPWTSAAVARRGAHLDGQGSEAPPGARQKTHKKQLQLQDALIYPVGHVRMGEPRPPELAPVVCLWAEAHTHDEKRCITWRGRGPIADEVVMRVGVVRVGGRGDDGCVR